MCNTKRRNGAELRITIPRKKRKFKASLAHAHVSRLCHAGYIDPVDHGLWCRKCKAYSIFSRLCHGLFIIYGLCSDELLVEIINNIRVAANTIVTKCVS